MSTVLASRGDISKQFDGVCTSAGVAVDLTGASVKFLMRHGALLVSKTATVVNALAGTVSYASAAGDLDVVGVYRQEWEVTWSPTRVLTFPEGTRNTVVVTPDTNPA
jgi:hypothetical protein